MLSRIVNTLVDVVGALLGPAEIPADAWQPDPATAPPIKRDPLWAPGPYVHLHSYCFTGGPIAVQGGAKARVWFWRGSLPAGTYRVDVQTAAPLWLQVQGEDHVFFGQPFHHPGGLLDLQLELRNYPNNDPIYFSEGTVTIWAWRDA